MVGVILGAAQARSRWSRGLAPWLVATGVGVLLCVIATGRGAAQSVNGRLLDDSTRAPIEQARVVLLTPDGRVLNRALTAKDGTFHLPAPAPGRYWVRAQRIGYAPTTSGPVEVPGFDSVVVELRLSAQALLLPPVSVVGPPLPTAVPDPYLERRGYYERRAAYGEEGMGVAHFLDAKKLRPAALQISDLLRELPGIYVTVPGGGKTVVTARGGCKPSFFLDGTLLGYLDTTAAGRDIEQMMLPASVAAVEVYPGPVVPVQYLDLRSGPCAVAVWTGSRR